RVGPGGVHVPHGLLARHGGRSSAGSGRRFRGRGMSPVLSVEDLSVTFHSPVGDADVLHGVNLELEAGRTLGIVGESGGGKSVLIRTLMGLHQDEPNTTVTGRSVLDGTDLLSLNASRRRGLWGREIAMIFQNPMTSLNPVR